MTSNDFQQMLVDLMRQGLYIEMFMVDGVLWFNMNTGMKSHLHLTYNEKEGFAEYRGRYDATGVITSMDDLESVVRGCNYGRGFCNSAWYVILKGILE